MGPLHAFKRKLTDEAGFGLPEIMVAAVLVVVGLLSALSVFDAAGKLGFSAQRHEQAISLAQEEIERLKTRPFAELMLDSAPQPPATVDDPNNPSDPRAYVAAANFKILLNYHDAAAGPPPGVSVDGEALIVDPNTADDAVSIPPVTAGVAAGDTTATVYRFVTLRDESCVLVATDLCPNEQVSRRITVAVTLAPAGGAGPTKPVYVSGLVTDPDVAPLDL